jgi:hypothetical protein
MPLSRSAARPFSPAAAPAPALPADWLLFHTLLPAPLLNDLAPKAPQAAYTPWVVTWLLVYQRLHGNASRADAVSAFTLRFPPPALPDCQRARPPPVRQHRRLQPGAHFPGPPRLVRGRRARLRLPG